MALPPDPHDPGEPTRIDQPRFEETTVTRTPGPPGRPPGMDSRWWWVIGLLGLIAVLFVVLIVVASDDDDDVAADQTTTSSESSTTTESTTTTTEATTTTQATTSSSTTATTAPQPTVNPAKCTNDTAPDEPEPVAQVLYEAWTLDDRDCAREVANDAVVDDLFSKNGTGANWTFQGCEPEEDPEPHVVCAFSYEGGAAFMNLIYNAQDGWLIVDIEYMAD